MGVYKKIKKAFSFKKDKKVKERRKSGTSEQQPQQTANGSLGKGSSEIEVPITETLHKETKKKSMSLRSIVRKASFGKKDKDRKSKEVAPSYASHESAVDASLLSNVITPVAAAPEQKAEPEVKAEVNESSVPQQTLPASEEPEVSAVGTDKNVVSAVAHEGESKQEEDVKIEDYLEVTAEMVKEIEDYERQLTEQGVKVRINEVEPVTSAERQETVETKPTERTERNEPHTITDVMNILSEKSEATTLCNGDADPAKPPQSSPLDGAAAESEVSSSVAKEVEGERSSVDFKSQHSSADKVAAKPVEAAYMTNGKIQPALSPMSRSGKGQTQELEVKLWRNWVAAFVVVATILAGVMLSHRSVL